MKRRTPTDRRVAFINVCFSIPTNWPVDSQLFSANRGASGPAGSGPVTRTGHNRSAYLSFLFVLVIYNQNSVGSSAKMLSTVAGNLVAFFGAIPSEAGLGRKSLFGSACCTDFRSIVVVLSLVDIHTNELSNILFTNVPEATKICAKKRLFQSI